MASMLHPSNSRLSSEVDGGKRALTLSSTTRRASGMKARAGFTLVEMVVVMLLLAIVGAVVIPGFFRSGTVSPMAKATQPLVQLLKFGQNTAVENNTPVTVYLDPVTLRYNVWARDIDTVLSEGVLEIPMSVRLTTESQRAVFTFAPTGDAFADSVLVSTGTGTVMVQVNPWSGDIDVLSR